MTRLKDQIRLAKRALKARQTGTSFSIGSKNAVKQAIKADRLNSQAGKIRFAAKNTALCLYKSLETKSKYAGKIAPEL